MTRGDQLYLEINLTDREGQQLEIEEIKKIQFFIGELIKNYEEGTSEVEYDDIKKIFKIFLTEEETFEFEDFIKIQSRVYFEDETIISSEICEVYIKEVIKKVVMTDDTNENTENE